MINIAATQLTNNEPTVTDITCQLGYAHNI